MAKAKAPAVLLSADLLRVLKAQRELGPEAYPLPLDRLLALTDPQAPKELAETALGKNPFKKEAVVAVKAIDAAPVALMEDAPRLAGSATLLEFLLERTCTEAAPAAALAALKKDLHTKLKKPFEESVKQRIEANDFPPAVGYQKVRTTHQLFLKRMPPPPPPQPKQRVKKVKPEVQFADNLLKVLEAQRNLGEEHYPLMLQQLIALTDPAADDKSAKKAIGTKAFKDRTVLGVGLSTKVKDSPIVLKEDREEFLCGRWFLAFLLRGSQGETSKAVLFSELEKKLAKGLKSDFAAALETRSEANTLPTGFGWMWIGGKKSLFRMTDVHTAPAPTVGIPSQPVNFSSAFEEAFQRLNREGGNNNFVSLVDLRKAVPVDRATFDAGLRELRIAGRYGLAAVEGRHGVTPEQLEAAIVEDGTPLLYVLRKAP